MGAGAGERCRRGGAAEAVAQRGWLTRRLNRALSEKIANAEVDLQTPGLSEHLWQTTMDKLAVDQPKLRVVQEGAGRK